MANRDHVAKLIEGVEAWNTWREENPTVVPDFRGERPIRWNDAAQRYDGAPYGGLFDDPDNPILIYFDIDVGSANLADVDVRSITSQTFLASNLGSEDGISEDHIELSTRITQASLVHWEGLTQTQVNSMRGDAYTTLPDHLEAPGHWISEPVEGMDDVHEPRPEEPQNATPPSKNLSANLTQKPTKSDIRAALQRDYAQPRDLAVYIVAQIQREIAVHETLAIPNEPEGFQRHENSGNMLAEMLVAVQSLHSVLPETASEPNAEELETLRTRLTNMLAKVDQMIETLHSGTGYKSDFWALGIISGVGAIATALGGTFVVGAGLTATIVGRKRVADGLANVVKLIKE